jgi:putative protease
MRPALCVLVRTADQLRGVLDWKPGDALLRPAAVYCDFGDPAAHKDAVASGHAGGLPIALATTRILKPGEEDSLRRLADCAPDAVLVRNLGAMRFFRREHPTIPLVGDASLNVANELSAAPLLEAGLARLTPGCDLNFAQLADVLARIDPARIEVVAHQHVPMFHMEHCVFASRLSEGRDSGTCGRACEGRVVEMRDRIGEDHPLIAEASCRNTVFNSHAQSAAERVPEMIRLGVRRFRVELLRESREDVGPLLECYARLIAGLDDGESAWRRVGRTCRSRVTRGTWDWE